MTSACFERTGFSLSRLNRLCSGRDLDFKGAQGACTAIPFERRKNVHVFYECHAESVESAGVPTESVQCKVHAPDVGGYRIPEAKEIFTLVIVESTEKFGGGFIQSVWYGVDGKRGRRRWHG